MRVKLEKKKKKKKQFVVCILSWQKRTASGQKERKMCERNQKREKSIENIDFRSDILTWLRI